MTKTCDESLNEFHQQGTEICRIIYNVSKSTNWQTHRQTFEILLRPICEIASVEDVHQIWKIYLENWAKDPIIPFFSEQMDQLTAHTDQKIKLHFCQSLRYVSEKMSINFGKNIHKTEQNILLFHFSVNKWTN